MTSLTNCRLKNFGKGVATELLIMGIGKKSPVVERRHNATCPYHASSSDSLTIREIGSPRLLDIV